MVMNIRIKKAVVDFWANPGRTMLVVLALAIGLWGVGSLMVSETILRKDLRDNFLQTLPAHAVLVSKDFGKLDIAAIRQQSEIEHAEFRDLSLQRIEVYPDQWIPLWLFGVEDFENMTIAKIRQEAGERKPIPGSMLIERDGRLISNLRLGSTARVRTAKGIVDVPIVGISFDPGQAPATQDHFIYAYTDTETFGAVTGEPYGSRLLVRFTGVTSRQDVLAAVERLRNEWREQDIVLSNVIVPSFNEHPHQWQLNTLLLLEGSISLLAFLMGVVLVSQLMAAIMARQVRQIGVLKAIGASKYDILRIYLAMVLAFGILANSIAIPLAISSGFAFSGFVASKLNFDILTTGLPNSLYATLVLAGLVMPVIFSLPAIIRAIRVPVHEALSDYGISREEVGAGVGSRRRWALPAVFLLAVKNTLRRRNRLLVTIMTMALGVAVFSTGFNVRQSLRNLLTAVQDEMRHDVQVVLRAPTTREDALTPFRSVDGMTRVETWSGGVGELQSMTIADDDGTGIIALPYNTDLFNMKIEQGRRLSGGQEPEVLMNQKAMEKYNHPAVGGRVELKLAGKTVDFTVVGVVWELDKAKIYMDQEQYDRIANPEHLVNSLMFVAKDKQYAGVMKLKRDIEKAIAGSSLDVLYVMSQAERVKVVYDHLNIILTTIVILALTVLVVSALGMASATGITIMERTREIGVLRAIGATPRMIYKLFVAEGLIVCLVSIPLGLLLAWPLSYAAAPFFGSLMLGDGAMLRYAFSTDGLWITMAVTLLFGVLASRIPAARAVRVPTREALAYE